MTLNDSSGPIGGRPTGRIRARWRIGTAVVATLSFTPLLAAAPAALADTPQPDGPPDGGYHSWCYLDGFNQTTAADAAMTRLRDQTVVNTSYPGECGTKTDVRWRQGSITGAYGEGKCIVRDNNDRCDVYRLTLNMAVINDAARPVDQRTKTSCHELGHTVGVRHYFDNDKPGDDVYHSCMRSGEVTADWAGRITFYGNHHRGHINSFF